MSAASAAAPGPQGPAAPAGSPAPSTLTSLRLALVAVAPAFLFSRLVVLASVAAAPLFLPERVYSDLPEVRWHTFAPALADALTRWDGMHYLAIAQSGYQVGTGPWDTHTPFPPLYPWLMRLLGGWAGETGMVLAGLLVSNLCFLAALALLYRLTEESLGPTVARRTVLYLAVFPTSFFFSALYAEALCLLLVAGCLRAVEKERWILAGLAGGLAALTRVTGVIVVAVLLWEAANRVRRGRGGASGPFLAAGLAALGSLVFMAVLWKEVGAPLSFLQVQSMWGRAGVAPLGQLSIPSVDASAALPLPGFEVLFPLAVVALFVLGGLIGVRRLPAPYGVWFWSYLLVVVAVPAPAPLYSVLRFLLLAFPAFVVFAQWAGHPVFRSSYLIASLSLLTLSTILFTRWYWVA